MDIQVRINPGNVDYPQLRALLGISGWGLEEDYSDATLEQTIKRCSYFIAAYDSDRLVGYARAFTDDIMVTWLAEILVHPEYRRKGIGRMMMNELLPVTSHTAIYTQAFVGNEDFFTSFVIKSKAMLVACSRKPLTTDKLPTNRIRQAS
ncbi:MAG: hypothetical protein LZF86_110485 [Nitrospira sp.]|nr:MAG: hypothetical protein LZF86_110485 [Nitrospira sp.]